MKDILTRGSASRIRRALFYMAGIVFFSNIALAQHVANPFVGATQYLNPDYTAEVESAIATASSSTLASQMKVVENYPTAVWMDRMAAIAGGAANGNRLSLAQHITTALSQQVGTEPVVITIVIYDLPGRDCAALASNGEISIAGNGTLSGLQQYEQNYITPIFNALQSYATNPNLRFVLIIEPDSLPNLVTNTGMGASPIANCVAANGGVSGGPSLNSVYVQGVQYTLNTFHPQANVYQYLDIGQSAWLGWPSNLSGAIELYNGVVKGTTAGYASIDGFISNTSNYVPTVEPFMTADQQIGGNPVKSATFYQYDPSIDELDYDQAFYAAATAAGFPSSIGFLIDTSRNGWGGPLRPAEASSATDVNTFVKQSKIDERGVRGVWCNILAAGIGAPPVASPGGFSNLQAYVWIKPPGESDGNYPGSMYGGTASTSGDPNCNPANTNALASGPTDSMPDSPPAGVFWPAEFAVNVQNAYPTIAGSSSQADFSLTASPVTVAPGATATTTLTIAATAGFSGEVSLAASGLPAGVTVEFSPQSVSGSGVSTLTFTAAGTASEGESNVVITGTSGSATVTATIALTVSATPPAPPAISASATSLSVSQAASATDTISLVGFNGNATLSISGLPGGVTAAFNPSPAGTASRLQLSANAKATVGQSILTVTATAGNQTASTSIALTVVATTPAPASFSLSPSPGTVTVTQGNGATYTISLSGTNGFTGSVALTATITSSPSGAVNSPSLSFNGTSPVNVSGTGAATSALSFTTVAASSPGCTASRQSEPSPWGNNRELLLSGVLLLLLPVRKFRGRSLLCLGLLGITFAAGMTGCGNQSGGGGKVCPAFAVPGTTTGTYVITVSGASGSLTESTTVNLTVQ